MAANTRSIPSAAIYYDSAAAILFLMIVVKITVMKRMAANGLYMNSGD